MYKDFKKNDVKGQKLKLGTKIQKTLSQLLVMWGLCEFGGLILKFCLACFLLILYLKASMLDSVFYIV